MGLFENHDEDEFFKLMNDCKTAAGSDLESLLSSLSEVKNHLMQIKNKKIEKFRQNDLNVTLNSNAGLHSESLPLDEYAKVLLELDIVRTGTISEKRIQDKIDECLDLCGYQTAFISAIGVIKQRPGSNNILTEGTKMSKVSSISSSSILSSIHTVRRLLLSSTKDESENGNVYQKGLNCQQLLREYIAHWENTTVAPVRNERRARANIITAFVDLIALLPAQIANACHSYNIQLFSWAERAKMYPRLMECAAWLAYSNACDSSRGTTGDFVLEQINIEAAYFSCLLQKFAHLGTFDFASSGMYKFWKDALDENKDSAITVSYTLMKASSSINSHRQSAALLCSNIKYTIGQSEIYSAEMSPSQTYAVCKKNCMPYLEPIWIPVLQSSSMLQDALIQMAILSSLPTADMGEQKLLACCVVLLLASCEQRDDDDDDDGDDDDDSQSDDESLVKEREFIGNEVILKHLADVSMIWNDTSFIRKIDHTRQQHMSYFILYAIDYMDKSNNSSVQQIIVQQLIGGVTNRLRVSESSIRVDGMEVAEKLGTVLGQSINFEELEELRGPANKAPKENIKNNASKSSDEKALGKGNMKMRKRHRRDKVLKEIDPDAEWCSDCDSDFVSEYDSDDGDSFYSSDSDWDEEKLVTYELPDEEEDLRVVAKPNYLRECLDLLRSADGDDHEAAAKQETALQEIPIIVRDMPPDLPDLARSLTIELLNKENKFNLDNFLRLRWEGLCSLAFCEPEATMEYLHSQLFADDISAGKRFDILEVMKNASSELSGAFEMEKFRKTINCDDIGPKVAGKRSLVPDNVYTGVEKSFDSITKETVSEIKTRRWGRGRRKIERRSVVNRFGPLAPLFFYPLVQYFMASKDDGVLWRGENGDTLLSRVLITLSVFVDNSGLYPGTATLAKDLFELSWSFFVAENAEVRQAVLVALASCLPHLPEEYMLRVIFRDAEVPKILNRAASVDSNENCRILASAILVSFQQSITL